MASAKMFPIGADFDMQNMVNQLVQRYQAQGFRATVLPLPPNGGAQQSVSIDLRKDDDDTFKKLLGLSLGLRVTLTVQNNMLYAQVSDEDWTVKAVVFGLGLVLSGFIITLALAVTGGIGLYQQYTLSDKLGKDIWMLASGGNAFYGNPPPYGGDTQQPPAPPYGGNNAQSYDAAPSYNSDVPAPQQAAAFCPSCGMHFEEADTRCTNCGAARKMG